MIKKILSIISVSSVITGASIVVVVQPELSEQDYRNTAALKSALEPYFKEVETKVTNIEHRLIVFPEYIGTWLVAVDEPEWVFRAKDENTAMTRVILNHPLRFIGELIYSLVFSDFKGTVKGHVQRSIFIMKAERIRDTYQEIFSDLALKYRAWVVAGSVLMPEADIIDGRIEFRACLEGRHKDLMNQCFIFDPEGKPVFVSRKVYPTEEELKFLDSAPVNKLSVINTDLGRLGVLICADSWYPECYTTLDQQGVDIIAVPSFVTPVERWDDPWLGYSPADNEPDDVVQEDKTGIYLESEMWEKYALCTRMGPTGAALGVNSFLNGSFWGMTSGGQSTVSTGGRIVARARGSKGKDILFYHLPD